jgi:hypothetical protein
MSNHFEDTMHHLDRRVQRTSTEPWMREWRQGGYRPITDYLAEHDPYLAYRAEHGREP